MTIFFPILLVLAAAVCWPAYRLSQRGGPESRWLMALAAPALAVWLGLTMSGYGAQSLSNIIEVLWLVAAGVLLSYAKVFLLDRFVAEPRRTTYALMLVLALAAVLLRTFMPTLPE